MTELHHAVRALVGLLAAIMASSAIASVAELPSTTGVFVIDGALDEAGWSDAAQIQINIETSPGENTAARVKTVAYIVEDGENLYVAFDAHDPDPDAIRAYLRDRDSAWNDDFVGIVLDTYGDERRAFEFFANALGVQMDLTNDDVNKKEDESWDAIWDSAGKIHETGYIVEMQIPLKQLRFPSKEGAQLWGYELLRFYPREHRYRMSNSQQDRNLNCYLCQFEKLRGFEDAVPARDLEIVPTLTASQVESTDDPGTVPLDSAAADVEAGVSIRWGITPDLTANLAINPDFSQVEADVAQLDVNNQFALFYPEKRPFFLEGADYFSTPERAVFTRTVASPSVGAKLTGKRGKNTFGVFAAQDDVTNLLFPGAFGSDSTSLDIENTAFVGRYSRSFGNSSSVGALLTSRSGGDYHNHVGGVDMRWRISDQHSIVLQHMISDTQYPDDVAIDFEQPLGSFAGSATYAGYEYESRNWFGYMWHKDRSADFRADSGFIPQVDFNQQLIGMGRIWHGNEDDLFSRIRLEGAWDITHDDSGQLLEKEVEAELGVNGPMQTYFQLGGFVRDRLYDDILFSEDRIRFYAQVKPIGGLVVAFWASAGSQIDFANSRLGDQVELNPFIEWNATRHLLLRYEAVFAKLDSKDGPNIFDAAVHDVRLTWQFSARSFLRFTAQIQDVERNQDQYIDEVDSVSNQTGRQLLYSYKLNPQTVFFLGYSDNYVDDDDLSRMTVTDRTWFMKIGYAWTP